jgi:hypothetical protein
MFLAALQQSATLDGDSFEVTMTIQWRTVLPLLALAAVTRGSTEQLLARSASPVSAPSSVTVFFVPHAEMDLEQAHIPLTTAGYARAARLVRTFEDVPLTHVLSSCSC